MSTQPVRYFSLFISQAGSAINGFCTEPTVMKMQQAIKAGDPFMLQMKGDRGYSMVFINPLAGSLSVRCNMAQEGGKHWEAVPVDANGLLCDPTLATQQILPADATQFHIDFLDPGKPPLPPTEKPSYVPSMDPTP